MKNKEEWVIDVKRDGKWVTLPFPLLTEEEALYVALLMKEEGTHGS